MARVTWDGSAQPAAPAQLASSVTRTVLSTSTATAPHAKPARPGSSLAATGARAARAHCPAHEQAVLIVDRPRCPHVACARHAPMASIPMSRTSGVFHASTGSSCLPTARDVKRAQLARPHLSTGAVAPRAFSRAKTSIRREQVSVSHVQRGCSRTATGPRASHALAAKPQQQPASARRAIQGQSRSNRLRRAA